jgi:hypothetical protein
MSRNGRKLLYSANRVHALFARMRADLHDMHFEHLCELADLRRELDATRAALDDLRAAVLARQRAEAELACLYRERAIARARAAERAPTMPLN